MKELIQNSIKKAKSYIEYKKLISDLIKEGKSTGINQNDELLNYTKLNEKRMKRLDKKTKLSETAILKSQKIEKNFTWLILTESWCGDAAHTLPVLNKFAEANSKIDLKVVFRDENDDLMNQFLTHGSKSIPKLIVIDKKSNTVVNSWGPRSKKATNLLNEYKEKNGKIDTHIKKELQYWYNNDKGKSIENDIVEFLDIMR
ncbi:MAG: thioredoxin family protein [Flavobacteriaceae bacterium]|nr:thioredoxin family protein [Flavobacteriaceae bacterium]